MHSSIPRIFVCANRERIFQVAQKYRVSYRCSFALILWLILFDSAIAQRSYLGKWNSSDSEVTGTDQSTLNQLNRALKPSKLQDRPTDQDEFVPRPNRWQSSQYSSSQNETQPKPFLRPEDVPLLVPENPSEGSFTAPGSRIEGDEFIVTSSQNQGRLSSESQSGNVQATSFDEPVQTAPTPSGGGFGGNSIDPSSVERACQWIDQFVIDANPNSTGIDYRPVSLVELLRQPIGIDQRSEMIGQYWETWSQWAELKSRTQFADWINSISASTAQLDVQSLTTSKFQSENQILQAKTFLSNAQSRLQSFLIYGSSPDGSNQLPPLPSDNPLIHPYVTNYQLYQKHLRIPEKFRNIDWELEDNLSQIVKHTQAAESAKASADSQLTRYQSGQIDLASVFAAGQTWRQAEMNLIKSVAQYNQKIADYSLNVTDGRHAPETVAAMLIGKSGNKRATAGRSPDRNSNFRSAMQPALNPNKTSERKNQFELPRSVVENSNDTGRPISSALSNRGSQPAADSNFRRSEPGSNGLSQPNRPAASFSETAAARSVVQPSQGSTAFSTPTGRPNNPESSRADRSIAGQMQGNQEGEFSDESKRPGPERNEIGGAESNRFSNSNASNSLEQPTGNSNSNEINPSSNGSRSAQFNPLTPLKNPSQTNPNELGNNPSSGGFDQFKSSNRSIDPLGGREDSKSESSNAAIRSSNPNGLPNSGFSPSVFNGGGSSNPSGGFNPTKGGFQPNFKSPNRPAAEISTNGTADFNPLPVENKGSEDRPILPPASILDAEKR